MTTARWIAFAACSLLGIAALIADDSDIKNIITGEAAFGDFKSESPGTVRKITVADLPKPFATKGVSNGPQEVARKADNWPKAPQGFKVDVYVTGIAAPRKIVKAPNGDLFVAQSDAGQVEVFRGLKDGKPEQQSVFAKGLKMNYGIAFYPLGDNPQWVYFGNTNSVVRYPYHNGDLKASGPAQTIIEKLPAGGGHWTRDLAFSLDGTKLFVAVGSASNIDNPDTHKSEFHRADILEFTPEGKFVKVYASGIRNPAGIAVDPNTGQLWCSVNERDMIGDNLVPDYITSVKEGGFYGWPWYYMGNHHDPRLPEKPELAEHVIVPDVLLRPHNASLAMTFYEGNQFPSQYKGDIFAAEHGSWNRSGRVGYEVIRVPLDNGHAKGEYEDFITGFVNSDGTVWGRPVGVAVASDGSLMFTDDTSKSIWRVSYTGK
jgi:glucose/arabinose dehydrogenase